jgi:hypothetical protein
MPLRRPFRHGEIRNQAAAARAGCFLSNRASGARPSLRRRGQTMTTLFRTREPSDWWNTVALGVFGVIAFLVFWFNGCSPAPHSAVNSNNAAANASNTLVPPAG